MRRRGFTPGGEPAQDFVGEKFGAFFRLPHIDRRGFGVVAALGLLLWLSSGLYKVQPDEQGVILRFGKWIETSQPGLHFHLPWPIDSALFPKVTQINQLQLGSPLPRGGASARDKQMLTGDENIVEADCALSWRIKDAGQYLFHVAEPETALRIAAESALREVIGRTPIQAALSDKRQQIADETRVLLQKWLDAEEAGVNVAGAIAARRSAEHGYRRLQRRAARQSRPGTRAQRGGRLRQRHPAARPRRSRTHPPGGRGLSHAGGEYRRGRGEKPSSIYESYLKAKDVTAWRLYLESLDEILRKSGKVIIDGSGKGVAPMAPYMPLSETRPVAPAKPEGAGK